MSSYLPGKKQNTRESCLVRGYWGDILLSPYIAFGVDTDIQPEKERLFKICNK
jgi:dynein assembly factor 3